MIDSLQNKVCFKVRIAYLSLGMLVGQAELGQAYPGLAILQLYICPYLAQAQHEQQEFHPPPISLIAFG